VEFVAQLQLCIFSPLGVAFKNQNGGGQQFHFFQRAVCARECNYDIEPAGGRKRAAVGKKWRWGSKNVFSIMSVRLKYWGIVN
jgi:hypothetical protein